MTVSYAMMSHPLRADAVKRIVAELRRPCTVFIDQHGRGPWASARRAWEWFGAGQKIAGHWCCLLQDDIDLAPHFADTLEWLVTLPELDGRPLSLCNGLPDRAIGGEHWVERQDGVHGPCIVLRHSDIMPMLIWVQAHVREAFHFMYDDIRVSLWLESLGRSALWPDPSWVQHRGWEPSLLGTKSSRSQPRTAPSYDGRSLTLTDWRNGLQRHPALTGKPLGASWRVRNKLWRVNRDEPDVPGGTAFERGQASTPNVAGT